MVGVSYDSLELDYNRAIDMGNRLALKTHKRRVGDVKPRRHRLVLKVRTEERIMDFLTRYVGGKK